jgi:TMEM192 family
MEPDDEMLDPVLADSGQNRSKKLKTIPLFSFHLLVSTAISVVGIILAATWKQSQRCEAYFIMLYLRAAFWVVTFLFDHFVQSRHKQLRLQGYHQFHRTMENHRRMPLAVVSLWNCALLTIAA